jgi:hypothetical protein
MTKRTNLKAVETKPEPLTWEQIDRLARRLTIELMDSEGPDKIIMLLMQEIASHPFDHSHVETIANLVNTHLFGSTREADLAFKELIGRERAKLEKGSRP